MRTTEKFLSYLCSLDVKLWIEDSRLRCNAPKDVLTPVIKEELAERKEDILVFLRNNSVDVVADKQPISPVKRQGNFPLSFAQQRLWFTEQLTQVSQVFDTPTISYLKGSLDVVALQSAINEIVRRHEILRTSFTLVEGKPVQVIHSTLSLPLPIVDLQKLPELKREAEIQRLIGIEASKCFNLTEVPLLWCILIKLSEKEHIVFFIIHHIVTDGWSVGILNNELTTLYEAFSQNKPSPLAELPIQYVDFAIWQRDYLQGKVLDNLLSYWKQKLTGSLPVLNLPLDYPRPAIQTFSGKRKTFFLSADLTEALRTLSRNEDVTLFMTLLAAFKTLLYRYTGQHDILVGSPIANRNQDGIEQLIGFFVNTLVLRTNLSGNPSFKELLRHVRETTLGAYAHQDMPFELLVDELQVERNLSYSPLFQVMFVFHNAPIFDVEMAGLTFGSVETDNNVNAIFDLDLHITEIEGGIEVWLDYNTDLFKENTICRMASHLQTLLSGIVANPQQHLLDLPLLTESEQQTLLFNWNNTTTDYPQDKCIHELFEAQVEKTPDAIAVAFENQQLSYRELNRRANQLAHYLHSMKLSRSDSLGVKSEVLVGLSTQRSIEMIIGLLAILKAGGAYVPLDPAYPQERIALMLNDAQVPVLLTQQHLLAKLPVNTAKVVCLDKDVNWQAVSSAIKQNPVNQTTPANLVYVIYTSGSTGVPKGVTIQHQSLVNLVQATIEEYEIQGQDRILQFTSISFDVAVEEIFSCLLSGATLVLQTNDTLASIPAFLEKCQQQSISILNIPTSFWHHLTSELSTSKLSLPETIRLVITGSEKAFANTVNTWRKQVESEVRLVNVYGSTETTISATVCDLAGTKELIAVEPEVPIGRAIANVQTYVLDSNLQPVSIGVWGELYIGGVGVARGYLHQPELTAQKFIPNPFSEQPGSRLYKTGDRVRYRSDGQIEFNGRVDNQVKIRGFRIELGEIEAVLSQHPDVHSTVVIARQDYSNDERLVAYILPELDKQKTTKNLNQHLRNYLSKFLPNYMLPSAFVMLNALPLTSNGKVDYKALPAPDAVRPELEVLYQPPQTEIEKTIVDIWQEVLYIDKVGINDNFFELGGHSLLLVQVHSKLQKIFQKDLLLVEMFQLPTVSHLAEYFSQESRQEKSFIQHSHRSQSRKASTQRRKQARKEHRAATKERGISSQSGE